MCGRFAQSVPLGILKKIDIFSDFDQSPHISYNTTPGENADIIIFREKPEIINSKWGLVSQYGKNGNSPKLIINARSETAAEKFTFKKLFHHHRCIIPVSGFYEWEYSDKLKKPFYIYPAGNEADNTSLLFMAGLYQIAASDRIMFTVLTRESSEHLKFIHNRMPVCIPPEKLLPWLRPDTPVEELFNILEKHHISEFRFHSISDTVNNPSNKSEECIRPAEGQGSFI